MRVLFISGEMIAGSLALRLKQEGCEVKLFIEDESRKDCFENMIQKTDDWQKELKWVGKNGLIVFDDVGYGKIQDKLRQEGFLVVGGSEGGDRLEKDRAFGQKILAKYDIKSLKTSNFETIKEAIGFIKKDKNAWVLKQNNHTSSLTYIGIMADGSDVLEVLESYDNYLTDIRSLSLQQKVYGVEIAAARYFNGHDFVGPIEMNIEHKHLCNNDLGPLTGEMGTLTWYTEESKLFDKTLAKIKPYLKKVNFRGDIDINCILYQDNIYPLEVTARFGCPSTQLQMEIHKSPWKDFLMAIAKGKNYKLKYKKGFGIVVSIAIPPFPYKSVSKEFYLKGTGIFFDKSITKKDWKRIHFEEVSLEKINGKQKYCIAGSNGFILYVTGFGKSVPEAQKDAYSLIDKIIVPKMMYRTDIGKKFLERDKIFLKNWGWI